MEHLTLLRQGVEVWNQWRKDHPDEDVDLSGANLSGAKLRNADLSGADLSRAYLTGVDLTGVDLSKADLSAATLSGANLSKADLIEADLSAANLSRANLSGADLSAATITRANLSGANLSGVNLSGATITRANLSGADLRAADLRAADLTEADLTEANLTEADLSGANLTEAALFEANLTEADLSGANLSGATLVRAILVKTNLEQANLTGCSIYGISVWNVQLSNATQSNLIITAEGEPTITVDSLEIAQFIYLLLEHKKLRDVLNSVMEKGVLLLGRFSDGGLELLQAVAAQLRKRKYLPMIFDFDRPDNRDYTETVKTLIGLSRFVIVDLSGPSVPQELYATIPHFDIPFIPILQKGRKAYSMFDDLLKYPWVVQPIVEFANKEHLMKLLPSRILAPAEERSKERQQELKHLFNR